MQTVSFQTYDKDRNVTLVMRSFIDEARSNALLPLKLKMI